MRWRPGPPPSHWVEVPQHGSRCRRPRPFRPPPPPYLIPHDLVEGWAGELVERAQTPCRLLDAFDAGVVDIASRSVNEPLARTALWQVLSSLHEVTQQISTAQDGAPILARGGARIRLPRTWMKSGEFERRANALGG